MARHAIRGWQSAALLQLLFATALPGAHRLKTLKGLTPYEFICKCWTSQPDDSPSTRIQQMPGLNA